MATTITTQRCIIQDRTADMAASGRRWVVMWPRGTRESLRIVCETKAAAQRLAELLDMPGMLWLPGRGKK